MSIIEITPFKKPVTATIDIPGSKSYTNRALIMAALTNGPVTLFNPLYCDDTETMIACLKALGLNITSSADKIIVHDDISVVQDKSYELYAKDSGTTARFLLALLCITPGTKVVRGNIGLSRRPIKDLVDALRALGATIDYLEIEGMLPVKIHSLIGEPKREITLDTSLSSQFLSALLMISPLLNGLKINVLGKAISKPYVDMTIRAMQEKGINIVQTEDCYDVPPDQSYKTNNYVIEGDFSSAGYFFAIAALTLSKITVKNLNPHSVQADRKFLDILASMGNVVEYHENAITIQGKGICPRSLNMEECPDQVQTMAVLAAFAKGTITISGVRSLRLKETERVKALKNELAKMGIKTEDTHDTLTVHGGNPRTAVIDTYGDHRMAMAFAVAGTKLPGMQIKNPEVVNKTFPTFWNNLRECS